MDSSSRINSLQLFSYNDITKPEHNYKNSKRDDCITEELQNYKSNLNFALETINMIIDDCDVINKWIETSKDNKSRIVCDSDFKNIYFERFGPLTVGIATSLTSNIDPVFTDVEGYKYFKIEIKYNEHDKISLFYYTADVVPNNSYSAEVHGQEFLKYVEDESYDLYFESSDLDGLPYRDNNLYPLGTIYNTSKTWKHIDLKNPTQVTCLQHNDYISNVTNEIIYSNSQKYYLGFLGSNLYYRNFFFESFDSFTLMDKRQNYIFSKDELDTYTNYVIWLYEFKGIESIETEITEPWKFDAKGCSTITFKNRKTLDFNENGKVINNPFDSGVKLTFEYKDFFNSPTHDNDICAPVLNIQIDKDPTNKYNLDNVLNEFGLRCMYSIDIDTVFESEKITGKGVKYGEYDFSEIETSEIRDAIFNSSCVYTREDIENIINTDFPEDQQIPVSSLVESILDILKKDNTKKIDNSHGRH